MGAFRSGAGLLAALDAQERYDEGDLLTEHVYDEAHDTLVVKETQDVEPILEYCAERQQDGMNGFGASRTMRHIAEIPMVIVAKWYAEGFNIFHASQQELRRKLREYTKFHTCNGRF